MRLRNTARVTSEHLLQHCRLQDILPKTTWPDDLPLTEELYGDLVALGSTAAFVRRAGVSV